MGGAGPQRGGKAVFKSEGALQAYLRQHPKADASKHSVEKPAKSEAGAKPDISGPALGASTNATMVSQKAGQPHSGVSHHDAADAHRAAQTAHETAAKEARSKGDHAKAEAHEAKAAEHKTTAAQHVEKAREAWSPAAPAARSPEQLKEQYRQLNRSLASAPEHERAALRRNMEGLRSEIERGSRRG